MLPLGQPKCGLPTFEFNDGLDQLGCRPFRAGFTLRARGVEPLQFEVCECSMTAQQSGGFNEDGNMRQPTWTQQQGAQPKEQTIGGAKIRGTSARATQDKELVPEQEIFGHQCFGATGPEESA